MTAYFLVAILTALLTQNHMVTTTNNIKLHLELKTSIMTALFFSSNPHSLVNSKPYGYHYKQHKATLRAKTSIMTAYFFSSNPHSLVNSKPYGYHYKQHKATLRAKTSIVTAYFLVAILTALLTQNHMVTTTNNIKLHLELKPVLWLLIF